MGPFIRKPRERILDHDEPPPDPNEHFGEYDNLCMNCTTCDWHVCGVSPTEGLRMWRVHRAAMILDSFADDDEMDW